MSQTRTHDPQVVAERWATMLAAGDLEELMSLYGRTAPLHVARDVMIGVDNIRRFWEGSDLLGGEAPERVTRANGVAVVRWAARPGGGRATTELLIRNGRITEQWIGEAVLGEALLGVIPLELSTSGRVSDGDRRAVVDVLEKVLVGEDDDLVHVRARMEHADDRNRLRPTTMRVVLDLKGGAIRAEVSAETTKAAIDMLEARLRGQLRHRATRRIAREHRGSQGDSWRHGDAAAQRPAYFPRPADERRIVRHKSVAPQGTSLEEALFDLSSMDYDFYLYCDETSGCEALISRERDAALVVHVAAGPAAFADVDVPDDITVDPNSAPTLDVAAARERLDVGHEPWVFFVDLDSGRGHVLYRRYDGHYGLIVPIDEPD